MACLHGECHNSIWPGMVHLDSVHGHGGAGRAGHLVGLVPDTWSRWCVADRSRVVPGAWHLVMAGHVGARHLVRIALG